MLSGNTRFRERKLLRNLRELHVANTLRIVVKTLEEKHRDWSRVDEEQQKISDQICCSPCRRDVNVKERRWAKIYLFVVRLLKKKKKKRKKKKYCHTIQRIVQEGNRASKDVIARNTEEPSRHAYVCPPLIFKTSGIFFRLLRTKNEEKSACVYTYVRT